MEISKELEELNETARKQSIGGVVFVSCFIFIGTIGNLHVLFIYIFRMKPSNNRIFILSLAVLDLTTCVVGMPFIVVDLMKPLTFTMIPACKILRFVNYFICTSSALILTAIAIDRYRKICVPLGRQISRQMAKIFCCVSLAISLLLSWPAPILFGYSSVNTTNPNITGIRCHTEDKFKSTNFQAYFNVVLIVVVLGVLGILIVMYSLIAQAISKQIRLRSTISEPDYTSYKPKGSNKEQTVQVENKNKSSESIRQETNTPSISMESISITATKAKYEQENIKHKERTKKAKRTTVIFFLITSVFFLSYFPHLILNIITFVQKDFVSKLSFTGKVLYNIFLCSVYVNNIANAFIYGFWDIRFRKEIKRIYNRRLCKEESC